MRLLSSAAVFVCLLGASPAWSAKQSTTKQARAFSQTWAEALASGKSGAVAKLYGRGAVLHGTFAKTLASTNKDIALYFRELFKKGEVSVKFHPGDKVRRLADNKGAVHTGTYTFSIRSDHGELAVPARFSFVYLKGERGKMKIVDHHSSLVPVDAPAE